MNQESISVIIVTYNNGHQIRACLSSLRQKPKPQQIFLIDNHSRDQTREQTQRFIRDNPTFPIQATWNNQNLGFAHGLNQGLKNAKSKFILLLTPDAELLPGALQQLMDHMQINSDVAMTAPQLLTPSGAIQPSCRRFPTYKDLIFELTGLPRLLKSKIHSHWKMDDFDHKTVRKVDQPEATCMFIRATSLEKVGLMDERFPIFFNDVDWCKRFQFNGLKIFFTPRAQAIHNQGTSVSFKRAAMIWKSHQGFYRYFQKHHPSAGQKVVNYCLGFFLIFTALLRSLPILLNTKTKGDR